MASEFALVGTTPRNVRRACLGVFKDRPAQLVPALWLINGRASYQCEGSDKQLMWFAGSTWFVGRLEDVGRRTGFIRAEDQAQRPELIMPSSADALRQSRDARELAMLYATAPLEPATGRATAASLVFAHRCG